jgi:Flp pilus assembly protein TadG
MRVEKMALKTNSKAFAFLKDRSGNFALWTAVLSVPILVGLGLAVNYGVAISHQSKLQNATDIATLAAASLTGMGVSDADRTAAGNEAFAANFTELPATIDFEYSGGEVIGTASYRIKNAFGNIMSLESIDVDTQAVVNLPSQSAVNIVLALDYSGSMNQRGKYQAMRDAAIDLVQEFAATTAPDRIKIGLVPFSEYVLADIDASYIRVVHPSHYGETARACLGTRFAPSATDQATPDPLDENAKWPTIGLATYFASEASSGQNRELICTPQKNGKPDKCEICVTTVDAKGKAKVKCDKVEADQQAGNKDAGKAGQEKNQSTYTLSDPDCVAYQTNGLLARPLTNDHNAVIAQLANARPVQLTNIALAMDVSAHMLSPQPPFTEAVATLADAPKRFVVLLTDGEQTVPGYAGSGRSGNQSYNIKNADDNTASICEALKADGVTVITIAFDLKPGKGKNLIADCASGSSNFFDANDNAQLAEAFKQISKITQTTLYLKQ